MHPAVRVLDPGHAEPDPRGHCWRVWAPIRVEINRSVLTIPTGYTCDGATIPHLVRWLISPDELGHLGPVVHDALTPPGECPAAWIVPPRLYGQAEADRVFRALMEWQGVAPWRCRVAYLAVRVYSVLRARGWRE